MHSSFGGYNVVCPRGFSRPCCRGQRYFLFVGNRPAPVRAHCKYRWLALSSSTDCSREEYLFASLFYFLIPSFVRFHWRSSFARIKCWERCLFTQLGSIYHLTDSSPSFTSTSPLPCSQQRFYFKPEVRYIVRTGPCASAAREL